MKYSIFKNLVFLCIYFCFNANATKECSSCKSLNADPTKIIFKNNIESQILQGIKDAFVNKEVSYEIPKDLRPLFVCCRPLGNL